MVDGEKADLESIKCTNRNWQVRYRIDMDIDADAGADTDTDTNKNKNKPPKSLKGMCR